MSLGEAAENTEALADRRVTRVGLADAAATQDCTASKWAQTQNAQTQGVVPKMGWRTCGCREGGLALWCHPKGLERSDWTGLGQATRHVHHALGLKHGQSSVSDPSHPGLAAASRGGERPTQGLADAEKGGIAHVGLRLQAHSELIMIMGGLTK